MLAPRRPRRQRVGDLVEGGPAAERRASVVSVASGSRVVGNSARSAGLVDAEQDGAVLEEGLALPALRAADELAAADLDLVDARCARSRTPAPARRGGRSGTSSAGAPSACSPREQRGADPPVASPAGRGRCRGRRPSPPRCTSARARGRRDRSRCRRWAAARGRRRARGTRRGRRGDRAAGRSRARRWAAPTRRSAASAARCRPGARARAPRRWPCWWRRRSAR